MLFGAGRIQAHHFYSRLSFTSRATGLEKWRLDFVSGAVPWLICDSPLCEPAFPPVKLQQWNLSWRNTWKVANQKCLIWAKCYLKIMKLMLDDQCAVLHTGSVALSLISLFNSRGGGWRQWNQREDLFSKIFPRPSCVVISAIYSGGRWRRKWPDGKFIMKSFDG